ncbi:hypothetical protein A374_03489 [Fictibacillus macauensis ZFHKF-1]|uniref:DUF2487 family protein n=1 Tax=Fictibacillus macauensis ZFHKF-1 TaxID=1196324 RepID=I8AL56_9BACL|nr:YpiF family protein [Fictibacillus macauensis]EIT86602.1 hypothetical protein A374_03489 [Fictibacillus macauensis ZFHKF-1]
MKWKSQDVAIYHQSQEYVDTVVVPLIPMSFGTDMKTAAMMSQYARLIVEEMERQLHGRLFLVPEFVYGPFESEESLHLRLQAWRKHVKEAGFTHLFYVTSDVRWKKDEHLLEDPLLWVPAIPIETMSAEYQEEIVKEQAKQLFQVIVNEWSKAPL